MTTTDARELDARVAELVMGWRRWVPPAIAPYARLFEPGFNMARNGWDQSDSAPLYEVLDHDAPLYTTDPSDDYEVLRHVRETWDTDAQYRFAHALAELYRPRKEGNHPILRYMPGDYSRAALAVMEEE